MNGSRHNLVENSSSSSSQQAADIKVNELESKDNPRASPSKDNPPTDEDNLLWSSKNGTVAAGDRRPTEQKIVTDGLPQQLNMDSAPSFSIHDPQGSDRNETKGKPDDGKTAKTMKK